jgi:uncharacterized protein YciI
VTRCAACVNDPPVHVTGYPFSDDLVPEVFDEHTIVFLIRPDDAPAFTEEELDRLQAEHLTYLRALARRGVMIANGPLIDQTDERLRGVSVYAVSRDEALGLANDDPMVRAGRLRIDAARWMTTGGSVTFGRPAT